jgi:hypothetical protein
LKLKTMICLMAAWMLSTVTALANPNTPEFVKSGGLIIKEGQMADLDTGRLGSARSGADIYFAAWKADNRHLAPRPNVLLGYIGQMRPDYNKCKRAARSTQSIKIELLVKNSSVCIKTTRGSIGYFRVAAPIGPSPGMLGISYKLWNDCPFTPRGRFGGQGIICCYTRGSHPGVRIFKMTQGCKCRGAKVRPSFCRDAGASFRR